MGLTTWKHSPDGRILKSDVMIAKNYLDEKQIKRLERTVSGYFDYIDQVVEKYGADKVLYDVISRQISDTAAGEVH